ncbi:MAG: glycosyltransferase family 2 protein [Pseudomonadota bacterium]
MVRVSVVIPAYNEEKTIIEILEKIAAQQIEGIEFETVVIDDGSKDETVARVKARPELFDKLIEQPVNQGKGAAVMAGIRSASGEYILFQDADLEYDPADYDRLLRPVQSHDADIVMGSRLIAPEVTRVHYFWNKVGNRFITLLFNILHNTTFTDIYSCYLVYRRSLVDPDRLTAKGWGQQAEILSMAVAAANVIYEAPISYHGRTYADGKKIRAHHVLDVVTMMVRTRFGL